MEVLIFEGFKKFCFLKKVQGFDCHCCSVGGLFSGTVAFSSGGFPANGLFDLSISLANG